MKALLIDSKNKEVKEVEVNHYTDLYELIGNGCRNFACPVTFENEDTLYVDDEGLFNNFEGGYTMKNWSYPIVGNGVIQGTDSEGESIDVAMTKQQLEKRITWVSKETCEAWADNFR